MPENGSGDSSHSFNFQLYISCISAKEGDSVFNVVSKMSSHTNDYTDDMSSLEQAQAVTQEWSVNGQKKTWIENLTL